MTSRLEEEMHVCKFYQFNNYEYILTNFNLTQRRVHLKIQD